MERTGDCAMVVLIARSWDILAGCKIVLHVTCGALASLDMNNLPSL